MKPTELVWAPALPIPQPEEVWQRRAGSCEGSLAYIAEGPSEDNGFTVHYYYRDFAMDDREEGHISSLGLVAFLGEFRCIRQPKPEEADKWAPTSLTCVGGR